jgi:hypothetical protein
MDEIISLLLSILNYVKNVNIDLQLKKYSLLNSNVILRLLNDKYLKNYEEL